MSLGNIMLGAVVLAAIAYIAVIVTGMIALWPYGVVGLAILAFMALIFGTVVVQRVTNKEDRHYIKNVKE